MEEVRTAGHGVRQTVAASERKREAGAIEHVARACASLRRSFWRSWSANLGLPPWRELLRVLSNTTEKAAANSRWSFCGRFTGEQFALPEAIRHAREVRRRPATDMNGRLVSGVDPINLAGILKPGPRLAALAGNPVLIATAVHAATLSGG